MPAEIAAISARVFPEDLRVSSAELNDDFIARFRTVTRECLNSIFLPQKSDKDYLQQLLRGK